MIEATLTLLQVITLTLPIIAVVLRFYTDLEPEGRTTLITATASSIVIFLLIVAALFPLIHLMLSDIPLLLQLAMGSLSVAFLFLLLPVLATILEMEGYDLVNEAENGFATTGLLFLNLQKHLIRSYINILEGALTQFLRLFEFQMKLIIKGTGIQIEILKQTETVFEQQKIVLESAFRNLRNNLKAVYLPLEHTLRTLTGEKSNEKIEEGVEEEEEIEEKTNSDIHSKYI